MESFRNLGISQLILKSIEEHHFSKPTYIQEKSIPLVLSGQDVVGKSATGSGKTLAFGCGMIQNLERGKGIGAIILTPTRELAEQVTDALKAFSKHKPLNIIAVYGGVSINPQIHGLQKADVVVATPGRLLDHLERGTIDLSRIKTLVLDEADRMLDMGFIDDVRKIINQCPRERQTLLYSATISSDIKRIASKYMHNPVTVAAQSQVDPKKLKQVYYDVKDFIKFSLLAHLLKEEHSGLLMVFCNTRKNVDFVSKNLKYNGIDAIAIHGGFTQSRRSDTMKKFQSENVSVLVCTDVAARGLDIPNVSHIYNYDMPTDSKEYIHRIGRTARAGNDGKVINLISSRDHDNFSNVLRSYSELNIEKERLGEVKRAMIKESTKTKPRNKGFGKPRFGDQKRFGGRRRFGNRQAY